VARNGFNTTCFWVLPKGVFFALSTQHATVTTKVPEKHLALHPTTTTSWLASGGRE
jgi:hypothetical protein